MFSMYKKIRLPQGRRLTLDDAEQILQIASGCAEIYFMRGSEGEDYQQLYLTTVGEGHLVFGLPEQHDEIKIFISALEDCEVGFVTVNELLAPDPERNKLMYLRRKMNQWFYSTMNCRWLRYSNIYDNVERQENLTDTCSEEECIWLDFKNTQRLLIEATKKVFDEELDGYKKSFEQRSERSDNLMMAAAANLLHTEKRELSRVAEALEDSSSAVLMTAKLIAKHLGLSVKDIQLPETVEKSMDEVSFLRRLLQKYGVHVRLIKMDAEWYKKDSGVFIGYWKETNEPAAILPDSPGSYMIYSKSLPLGTQVTEEIAGQLNQEFFVCYEALLKPKLELKDLLRFISKKVWREDIAVIIVISILAGLIPLMTPLITETIFSDIIPINDRQALSTVTQIMVVSAFTMTGISYVRNIAIMRIKNNLDLNISSGIMLRVLSLPTKFFRKYEVGDLLTRIDSVHGVCDTLMSTSISGIFNLLFSFWSLGLMFFYSSKLTFLALVVWAVYLLLAGIIYYNIVRYSRKNIAVAGKVSGKILQIFNGLNKFRVDGAEEQAYALWAKVFGEQWHWNIKGRWQTNYLEIINSAQGVILPLLIYGMSMYWAKEAVAAGQKPEMDYARFLAFQAAFSGFNSVMMSVIPMLAELINIKPHLERMKPIMEEAPEIMENKADVEKLRGDIDLENVSFRYSKDTPMVIDDLTLHIRAGESVAIVGTSGCGKSTLVRLLLGFEKPEYGAVYYDRYNMEDINISSVRSQMGVVLQNGQLLTGSIFDNIVGTLPLTQEDAWEAASMVGLEEDISYMPMGLETVISEGANNISGGQKQRILLARALVNKPKIIIMDEATSALDNLTQKKVSDSVDKLRATRIIVAHRLSTVQNADRILVMDKGRIVESGTFKELMDIDGIFASLAKRQLT